jgi:hypothetical protein
MKGEHEIRIVEKKMRFKSHYPWWEWRCRCGKISTSAWLERSVAAYNGRLHVARAETGYHA